jgi:nicotinamide mononucleotide transporter
MDSLGQAWSFLVEHLDYVATFVTLACVILGVKRSLWQFPVGIVGTALFFIVVWRSHIYANAALQVFFVAVQFYGWWYWLRGTQGHRPPIRTTPPQIWLGACAVAVVIAVAVIAPILRAYTTTTTPLVDAHTFTLSVVAQFLLDRKRLESWWVWIAVNILSIWLYYQAQLWPFLALYVFFFFNAFWGWWEWRNAMRREAAPAEAAA